MIAVIFVCSFFLFLKELHRRIDSNSSLNGDALNFTNDAVA